MKPRIYKLRNYAVDSYSWVLFCPNCSSKTIFKSWQAAIDYVVNY